MDGSHHDWLEGRGSELVLMGYVDDATGQVFARFYEYEGLIPAFDSMYKYIEKYGVPKSIYLDKHSTYKTTRHQMRFEQLMGDEVLTKFEIAMGELGVNVIHANSAEAKGRVENKFKTFQDRLIKEMRLVGIKTLGEANKFLEGYLPKYNKRFSVPAMVSTDLHCRRPSKYVLDSILCVKEERAFRKNSTVHYKKRIFLITERVSRRVSRVIVEERLDGSIWIRHKGGYLKYKEIDPKFIVKAEKGIAIKDVSKRKRRRKSSIPGEHHPWRRFSPDHYIDPCDYEYLEEEKVFANV